MGLSVMQQIALLPGDQQQEALDSLDPEELLWSWDVWARPEQLAPPGDWSIWAYLAGRGAGKTRSAAEWVRSKAQKPGTRIILVGRTSADVRDVMIGGPSGIITVSPPSEMPEWKPSARSLTWPNGSSALAFSSVEPDQLRGPAGHYSWCDEAAAWPQVPDASGLTAFDNARIATREGDHPQMMVTTTPKRVPLMNQLLDPDNDTVVVTRGRTADNAAYLSKMYLDVIYGVYAGTSLEQQELEGILLDALEGALFSEEMISESRVTVIPALPYRVVAVDPSVAEAPRDECGITVVGSTSERLLSRRHAYVLEDATVMGSPSHWAKVAIETARRWRAPIVAEGNQGGELVRLALASVDPKAAEIPVHIVHARVNKRTRAEPLVGLYEQKRLHHWNYHPTLETQMTNWIPEETKKSPDRLDSLVWGVTALLLKPPKGLTFGGPVRAQAARGVIPGAKKQSYAGHRSSRAA